jgi:hypothetical protein
MPTHLIFLDFNTLIIFELLNNILLISHWVKGKKKHCKNIQGTEQLQED